MVRSTKPKLLLGVVIILLIHNLMGICFGFTPTRNVERLTELIDAELDDKALSPTLTHVDILKKGLVRSLTKYLSERQKSSVVDWASLKRHVDVNKSDSVYYEDVSELYKDYLSEEEYKTIAVCKLEIENVINFIADSVASVDFDSQLKDLPWAHFDANMFAESSSYVRDLRLSILRDVLINKNLASARKKIGLALHTIQDFYSHSNWIEMGYADKINEYIGSLDNKNNNNTGYLGVEVAGQEETACLEEKCEKKVLKCKYLKNLDQLVRYFNAQLPTVTCPIVYFKCKHNVITNKLTSGYFTGSRLPNGDRVLKPVNKSKCSHGGAFDESSFLEAKGGINKDTSFYFISPRADLHLIAAELAVKHTEAFFDDLRAHIGDKNFDELFQLLHPNNSSFMCFFKKIFS